jgi:hypothetical protein
LNRSWRPRGGAGIQLCSFFTLGTGREWVVKAPTPSKEARYPTHCVGGWVGPRAGLDGCAKSLQHRDSIPGPSDPQWIATPTELSRPTISYNRLLNLRMCFLLILFVHTESETRSQFLFLAEENICHRLLESGVLPSLLSLVVSRYKTKNLNLRPEQVWGHVYFNVAPLLVWLLRRSKVAAKTGKVCNNKCVCPAKEGVRDLTSSIKSVCSRRLTCVRTCILWDLMFRRRRRLFVWFRHYDVIQFCKWLPKFQVKYSLNFAYLVSLSPISNKTHMCNKIYVLFSTLAFMFRPLLPLRKNL